MADMGRDRASVRQSNAANVIDHLCRPAPIRTAIARINAERLRNFAYVAAQ